MKLENPCFWPYIKLVDPKNCGDFFLYVKSYVYIKRLHSELTLNKLKHGLDIIFNMLATIRSIPLVIGFQRFC